MAKKTQKQCARPEKDNTGCMSGLISIFDFRQGHYTQRLLSDRRHGSSRYAGSGYKGKLSLLTSSGEKHKMTNHDDGHEGCANLGPSVKILMEEEMSKVQQSKNIPSDAEHIRHSEVSYEKNHWKTNKASALSYDLLPNDKSSTLVPDKSNDLNTMERFSYNLHVAALLEEFCGDRNQCQSLLMDIKNSTDSCPAQKSTGEMLCDFFDQLDARAIQNHSTLHKLLIDMAEILINQDSNSILNDKSHQSEELINALGMSNPRELLMKLLQDPSSLLVKRIQEFENDQEGKSSKPEACGVLEEWNVSTKQCEEPINHKNFHKRNVRNFFRKKDRLQETKLSSENDCAQPLNKIVVLKPTPPRIQNSSNAVSPSTSQSHGSLRTVEEKERVASHFSLKEIKRRLKHVIGDNRKGQHMLSMDGVLHKIPYESQPSCDSSITLKGGVQTKFGSRISNSKNHASQLSSSLKKKEKKMILKETRSSVMHEATFQNKKLSMESTSTTLHRDCNFQREAKKHLAEMLTVVDSEAKLPARQISKPLGRMISLSEYNLPSPILSPRREKETSLSPRHMRFSPLWQLKQESGICSSPLGESILDSPCIGTTKAMDQVYDSKTNTQKQDCVLSEEISRQETLSSGEVSSPKGCTESVEPLDTEHTQEKNSLAVASKSTVGGPANVAGRSEEERSLSPRADSEMSSMVAPLVPATPVTLLVHDIGSPDSTIDKPERPSPVSVLEPLFTEDVSSPVDGTEGHVDFLVQPLQIPFEEQRSSTLVLTISGHENVHKTYLDDKESRFQYVRAVLEAASLMHDGLLERWHSSSPLLSPSLYDEVEYPSEEFPDDLRHLFDSINEVLEVTCEKLFSCTPWVSWAESSIRPIPSGESLIKVVWKGMDLHVQRPSPHTLDQIVRKDMEVETWMDLRSEIDGIATLMGDAILDDLMEETLLEFWY